MDDLYEREVIRAILSGQTSKFEELIERYEHHVLSIVGGHVPREDVSEVAHEVFIETFRSLSSYRGEKPFQHWLSKISIRGCFNYWRRRKRVREVSSDVPASNVGEQNDSQHKWVLQAINAHSEEVFQEHLQDRERREFLSWALAKLKPRERMVVTLHYLEERSMAETAELLGMTVVHTKVTALRARRALKKLFDNAEQAASRR